MNIKQFDYASTIGQQLGTVTIVKELGRGAMGAVFIAFQSTLKRQVAVKILPKAVAASDLSKTQFRDEAETIAALSHPNIIPIFEMGEDERLYYQVMQLINGSDLNVIIRNRLKHPLPSKRLLPIETTLDLMISVLDGLAYAHEDGVVHQDIKPANILVERRGSRPLIADFGIAKTAQLEYKAQGLVVGTPYYLAPEQAAAKETDARADVYAVGVILFEMLAGVLPMNREDVRGLLLRKARAPETVFTKRPSEVSALVNPDMERIILKATAANRDNRYRDAREFQEQLIWYRDHHTDRGPAASRGQAHAAAVWDAGA